MKLQERYTLWEQVAEPWCTAAVCLVQETKDLVAKVLLCKATIALEEEYHVAKLLQSHGISVPNFHWISKVKNRSRSYQGLIMDCIDDAILIKKNIPVGWVGRTIWNTLSEEYIRGAELLNVEVEKIESLDLPIAHQGPYGFDWQWLYQKRTDRIFLIDFWEVIYET